MSSFSKEVPHQLGRNEAKQRLQTFLEKVTQQFQEHVTKLNGEWDDNVLRFAFTTYGFNITGTLTVEENVARVEGKLPLAALLFKGAIEQSIGDELKRELA
jgi:hypothetical protein